jgi:hypothetical protein
MAGAPVSGAEKKGPSLAGGPFQTTTATLPGRRSDVKIHGVNLHSCAESHDSHDSIQSHGTGCHGKTPKGRRSAVSERGQPGCSKRAKLSRIGTDFIGNEIIWIYDCSMAENHWTTRWSKDQIRTLLLEQFPAFRRRDTGIKRTQLAEARPESQEADLRHGQSAHRRLHYYPTDRKRSVKFIAALTEVLTTYPVGRIQILVDNGSIHTSKAMQQSGSKRMCGCNASRCPATPVTSATRPRRSGGVSKTPAAPNAASNCWPSWMPPCIDTLPV